ncbi:MAG: dUTP diphosphatase [Acutalibacter sp.]|jgi:dUTP pyrophosphatase
MSEKPTLGMKKLREGAVLPQRQTEGAAGYDLRACVEGPVTLQPGEGYQFPTGLAAEIPQGYAGMVFCRSGLGVKHGISLPNCVGVIDSDYRGELVVPLRNFGDEAYTIQPGERIAQLVIMPVLLPEIVEVDQLSQTDRGQGGFGSTGR